MFHFLTTIFFIIVSGVFVALFYNKPDKAK